MKCRNPPRVNLGPQIKEGKATIWKEYEYLNHNSEEHQPTRIIHIEQLHEKNIFIALGHSNFVICLLLKSQLPSLIE